MEKKNLKTITPLLIITLFAVTSFVYDDFDLSVLASYGILLIISLVFVWKNGKIIPETWIQRAALMTAVVATIYVFLPASRTDLQTLGVVLSLDAAMIFIAYTKPDTHDVERTIKILTAVAIIMAFYAFIMMLFPDIYYSFLKNIVSEKAQHVIEGNYEYGYGIAIGGGAIVIDYYVLFGVIISAHAFIKRKTFREQLPCILLNVLCVLTIVIQNRKSELLMAAVVMAILFLFELLSAKPEDRLMPVRGFMSAGILEAAGFTGLLFMGLLPRFSAFFGIVRENVITGETGELPVDVSSEGHFSGREPGPCLRTILFSE